jgi:formamidopyrimidine-DNA glycosylase
MPELPEVETVRADLAATIVDREVVRVEATGTRTGRRRGAAALVDGATGRTVTAVARHGKYLLDELDGGPDVVVIHLRMSGQLRWAPGGATEPSPPHTHVVVGFDGGAELRFVDPRTFGEVFVTTRTGAGGLPAELAHVGPDPLLAPLSVRELGGLLDGRRTALKARLLDQRALAGLGNIYGDEVLFAAGVRPGRAAGSLRPVEVRRIAEAVVPVLERAVALRGSTLADAQYCDLFGRPGRAQEEHRVYARSGEPCRVCGRAVVRGRIGGRCSFWCPRCQR